MDIELEESGVRQTRILGGLNTENKAGCEESPCGIDVPVNINGGLLSSILENAEGVDFDPDELSNMMKCFGVNFPLQGEMK